MVCFPLDNVEYDASALGAWSGTRTRGVYAADGHYAVTANGGMSVRVSPGLAWLQAGDFWGVNAYENAAQVLMLDTADGSLDRVDAVCVRLDKNLNKGELVVKSGAYTPQPPTIATPVRDANYDEIYVATVYVRAGATEILQSDITDQRLNEAYCGIMRDGVTGIPTEELQAQWSSWYAGYTAGAQQEFGAWFESMKGQLSEDAAGNLQNQINSHAHTGEDGTVRVNAMDADTVDGMHGTEFLTRTGQIITSTMHADLNDYTEPGDYYCEANVTAATITNCPHPWAFYLEVRRIGNMVIQRWTSYDVGMVCMRYKSGDSWGNWRDDPLPYSGTWTPTFYVGETAQATTNASGKWWRLGPLVWVSFGATMANAPTVSSGELSIRGLPIAAVGQAGLACGNYNVPALDQEIVLLAVDGSKIRPLTYNVTGSYAGNSSALYGGKLAEGVTIRYASGCYLTE